MANDIRINRKARQSPQFRVACCYGSVCAASVVLGIKLGWIPALAALGGMTLAVSCLLVFTPFRRLVGVRRSDSPAVPAPSASLQATPLPEREHRLQPEGAAGGHDAEVRFCSVHLEGADCRQGVESEREMQQRYRSLLEHHPDAIFTLDLEGVVVAGNPSVTAVIGEAWQSLTGRPFLTLIEPEDWPRIEAAMQDARGSQSRTVEVRQVRQDRSICTLEVTTLPICINDKTVGLYAIARDVTVHRQVAQRLAYLAQFDALTELPNRNLFQDRLGQAMRHAQRSGEMVSVMFIDLDHFKEINDTAGHEAGDRVLRQVADRLRQCVRDCDTVARLGGDEFVIVLEGLKDAEHVEAVAEKLLTSLAKPFYVGDSEYFVTASIGITIYPMEGGGTDDILKKADFAMYQVKQHGRNNYQFFSPGLNMQLTERLNIKTQLHHALERDELRLCYQPQVDVRDGSIVGVEALLRWDHPQLGWIAPERFIHLAEETGLIVPIGEWVLRTACRQNKIWLEAGVARVRMNINLSSRQLRQRGFADAVERILTETALDPRWLGLEITEGFLIENTELGRSVLAAQKQLGIQIALDDFGTGYSSLSYLRELPLDVIKIDGSLVRHGTLESQAPGNISTVAGAIISLAHGLGLKVVAEGVETSRQLERLTGWGCDYAQGFFFSRPLQDKEMEAWFKGRAEQAGIMLPG